jgi:hypothetical protein
MEALNRSQALRALCRLSRQYGAFFRVDTADGRYVELGETWTADGMSQVAACIGVDAEGDDAGQMLFEERHGFLLFGCQAEMQRWYGRLCAEANGGRLYIYALTCGPDGGIIDENT